MGAAPAGVARAPRHRRPQLGRRRHRPRVTRRRSLDARAGRRRRQLRLPDPCLVVLVGVSGSGKSTWAARHFAPAQVVSSDALRAVVGLHERDQRVSKDAFAVLDQIVDARLRRGLTTVIDTTGLEPDRRAAWLAMARRRQRPAHLVVLAGARARGAGPATRPAATPCPRRSSPPSSARWRPPTTPSPPRGTTPCTTSPATSRWCSSHPASSRRPRAPEPNARLPCPSASPSTSAASSSPARARSSPTTCVASPAPPRKRASTGCRSWTTSCRSPASVPSGRTCPRAPRCSGSSPPPPSASASAPW